MTLTDKEKYGHFAHYYKLVILCLCVMLGIFILCLMVYWLRWIIVDCWRKYKEYKRCQNTPNLHPVHGGVQYISQQRHLYNLHTHLVKNFLVITCSGVEFLCGVWFIVSILVTQHVKSKQVSYTAQCTEIYYKFLKYFQNPYWIVLENLSYSLFLLFFIVLSILTRYFVSEISDPSVQKNSLQIHSLVHLPVCNHCSRFKRIHIHIFLFDISSFGHR